MHPAHGRREDREQSGPSSGSGWLNTPEGSSALSEQVGQRCQITNTRVISNSSADDIIKRRHALIVPNIVKDNDGNKLMTHFSFQIFKNKKWTVFGV